MSIYKESRKDRYDVVVIGSGVGGLTAAALLAKTGKSVLVIERHQRPGGAAHGFARHRYHFDSGVHLISGCTDSGYRNGRVIFQIMNALGLATPTPFIPVSPYAKAAYPGLALELYPGEDAFIAGVEAVCPGHEASLRALCRLCRDVAEELMLADEILASAAHGPVSPGQALPNWFRYRRATLDDVLDQFLPVPELRGVFSSLWPYLGLPPSRLSFLAWATMWAGFLYEGSYYCKGTFQTYANLLVESIRRSGGEVLLGASCRRILVENGEVRGVVLENHQRIQAATVISNVDMRQTADLLIGKEHLTADYCRALEQLERSSSVFVSYIATDLALSPDSHAHESFYYPRFDHALTYALAQSGHPDFFSVTIPSFADPELAPPGQHVVMLTHLSPYHRQVDWRTLKREYEAKMLAQAERVLPGLNQHLLFVESGSPRTVERYTLNDRGAAYGWAPTPEQIGARRPDIRGPLPGLYFAGHWTRPCGGITGVSFSGVLAAQAVLGIPKLDSFWRALGVG